MAHGLLEYEVFRNTIAYLDWILSHLSFAPAWKIQDVLWGAEEPSVDLPEVSQTVCTALQLALVELMRCWDLNPKVVVGHSSGLTPP
jgi:acyl transferase domain-containing protein